MIFLIYCYCKPLVYLLEKNLVYLIIVIVEIVEVYVAYMSRGSYPFHFRVFHIKNYFLIVVDLMLFGWLV